METESVTLILEITKPRKVTWFKNGEEIGESDHFRFDVDATGLRFTLTISDITMDENAEFSVKIDDQKYGVKTTSCDVTVKGQWNQGLCCLVVCVADGTVCICVAEGTCSLMLPDIVVDRSSS